MGSNTYNSFSNVILFATLSASVVSLPYTSDSLIPFSNHDYYYPNDIDDWRDQVFMQGPDHYKYISDTENIQAIIEFSKTVIDNSQDIDSEFVDIVNDKFWDLI